MAGPVVNEAGVEACAGYRTCSRVLDWSTTERMQLIRISERVNAVVRER